MGGRAGQNCTGPTDKYEIDSTVLDLYCVSSFNPDWVIGRPILYFVVDTLTRMIVGLHLALSGPKWDEARIAVFNALSDKVAFCARSGIPISEEDWPCHHTPQTILVDRGEMRAHKPRGLKEGLGIEVDLAPPFRGDFKSVVERRFRIINDLAIKWIPGAVRAREKERGDRDCRLDAILTLYEVQQVIIRCVLQHNNQREFPDLLTREMIRDGVVPTPRAMWNWGLKNAIGSPRQEDPKNIFCHLLRSGTATVQADGIWWCGIRYTCDTEQRDNWRALARCKGTWKIPIRWLPEMTDHIWIFDERQGTFEQCEILSPEEKFRGIRVDECLDAIAYMKLTTADREGSRLGAAIDDNKFYENLIAAAALRKKASVGMSKKEQLADISIKKEVERALLANPELQITFNMPPSNIESGSNGINAEDQRYRDELADLLASSISNLD